MFAQILLIATMDQHNFNIKDKCEYELPDKRKLTYFIKYDQISNFYYSDLDPANKALHNTIEQAISFDHLTPLLAKAIDQLIAWVLL